MSIPKSFIRANGMVITSVLGGVSSQGTTACMLPSSMKEHILTQPGFLHSISSLTSPAHRIMPVKGAGLGMYATCPIGAGKVIFAERALVITPQSIIVLPVSPDALSTHEDIVKCWAKYHKELMAMLLDRMSPENAAAYCALVNLHMNDGYGPLAGIFDTNSWQISIAEMRKAIPGHLGNPLTNISGMCDTLSCINHSCSPNARVDFDIASFSFVLHAVHDIPSDAEITVTYIYTEKVTCISTTQCQEALSSYGFTCTCMACSLPAISDPCCAELAALQVMSFPMFCWWLESWSSPADYFIKESEHILQLIADKGLEGRHAYIYHLEHLLNVYARLGDREKYLEVSEWVMQARRVNAWDEKPVPVGEPEKHKLWRARVRVA